MASSSAFTADTTQAFGMRSSYGVNSNSYIYCSTKVVQSNFSKPLPLYSSTRNDLIKKSRSLGIYGQTIVLRRLLFRQMYNIYELESINCFLESGQRQTERLSFQQNYSDSDSNILMQPRL